MNWIEKFNQLNDEAVAVAKQRENEKYLNIISGGNQYMYGDGFNYLEALISKGELAKVKQVVEILEPQFEWFKKTMKAVIAFRKAGGKTDYNTHSSPVRVEGGSYQNKALFLNEGKLVYAKASNLKFCPVRDHAKFFLYYSRLLRDAEKLCLKHPIFKQV